MSSQNWHWGKVEGEPRGGLRGFIDLCNNRFKQLHASLLTLVGRSLGWVIASDYADPTGNADATVGLQRACDVTSIKKTRLLLDGVFKVASGPIRLYTHASNQYQGYGRIRITGNHHVPYISTAESGGAQILHADGVANALVECICPATTTANTGRSVILEGVLLVGGTSTTVCLDLEGVEADGNRFSDLFVRLKSSTGIGVRQNRCWVTSWEDLTIRGTATGAGTNTSIGLQILSPSGGGTVNQMVYRNSNIRNCGTNVEIGERSGTGNATKGPGIAFLGGQTSHGDLENVMIGNGVRGVTFRDYNCENAVKQGMLLTNNAQGVVLDSVSFVSNGGDGTSYDLDIGGTTKDCGLYGRNLIFFQCARGIAIRVGSSMDATDLDLVRFNPATNGVGTGIAIDAVTSFTQKIKLGEQINYQISANAFATNLSDPNENAARPVIDNRVLILSGGETSIDVTNVRHIRFGNAGATTVTAFTGANLYSGKKIILEASNANTTLQNNATLALRNDRNFTFPASGKCIMELVYISGGFGFWVDTARLGSQLYVRKNTGANVGARPRLNLIEGTNITLTVADDAVDDEIDITIAASGGGGGTFFSTSLDFGTAAPTPSAVQATVADAGVGAASKFALAVRPGSGRDLDEMELGPVTAYVGNIVNGVSFDIIAVSDDETAHGTYLVECTRS